MKYSPKRKGNGKRIFLDVRSTDRRRTVSPQSYSHGKKWPGKERFVRLLSEGSQKYCSGKNVNKVLRVLMLVGWLYERLHRRRHRKARGEVWMHLRLTRVSREKQGIPFPVFQRNRTFEYVLVS